MNEKIIDAEFEDTKKSYMIKDIPSSSWRKFKIKFMEDGFDTCNKTLLTIIERYSKGEINVSG